MKPVIHDRRQGALACRALMPCFNLLRLHRSRFTRPNCTINNFRGLRAKTTYRCLNQTMVRDGFRGRPLLTLEGVRNHCNLSMCSTEIGSPIAHRRIAARAASSKAISSLPIGPHPIGARSQCASVFPLRHAGLKLHQPDPQPPACSPRAAADVPHPVERQRASNLARAMQPPLFIVAAKNTANSGVTRQRLILFS
jgi:hypothetical protein